MSVSGEHAGRESMELHILDAAKRLFARNGFDKVSMRDLAHEVGITPAALYHHFPNKSNLQVMALRHAHESTPAAALNRLRSEDAGREERLHEFVLRLCERFHEDPEFLLLLERAMLHRDEELRDAFWHIILEKNFQGVEAMVERLVPGFDKHMLTTFLFSLVVHTCKTEPIRRKLPSYRPEHDDPAYIAGQIMKLLRTNLFAMDDTAP